MAQIAPRTIDEILAATTAHYVDSGGNPLRIQPEGDLYLLLRAQALVQAQLSLEAYQIQQNALLDTCTDWDQINRMVNPFGIYQDMGKRSSGGIVALPAPDAEVKTVLAGALVTVNGAPYIVTEDTLLAPPWTVVPVAALNLGKAYDAAAGVAATLVDPSSYPDWAFVVGAHGLNPEGYPYGGLSGGTEPETQEQVKQKYYDTFGSSGDALVPAMVALAQNVDGVASATVMRHTPAPGYATIYIQGDGPTVPDALLLQVRETLMAQASAGSYLMVLPMATTALPLLVYATIDGSVPAATAKSDLEILVNAFMLEFPAGQTLVGLNLVTELANRTGYLTNVVLKTLDVEGHEVPFVSQPGEAGRRIVLSSLTVAVGAFA